MRLQTSMSGLQLLIIDEPGYLPLSQTRTKPLLEVYTTYAAGIAEKVFADDCLQNTKI